MTQTTRHDAIVIGAGFAGLTVARELSRGGLDVLILEARDRVGGRTWLDNRLGLNLEIGGTWVHWIQPHVWAELRRYGIGITPSPEKVVAAWWDGEQVVNGTPGELLDVLERPNTLLCAESREAFPFPYAPFASEHAAEIDGMSMAGKIAELDISAGEREMLTSFWSLNFNGRLEDAAYTQVLRWIALSNGDWKLNLEACSTYKVEGGTRTLADAMLNDSAATVRFGADVTQIDDTADVVTVSTSDGTQYTADHVVLTAPLQALTRIEFSPALPAEARTAAERGQVGLGTKVWFTLEGEHPHFLALGSADWPLNFFQSEYVHDGKTYVVGFGPDAHAIDPEDTPAVQEALSRLRPDLRVLDSVGHSWVDDEFSQETWPMHRTGYLSRALSTLQQPFGRVQLAGSDFADGWGGFIDGAIESGFVAARRILDSAGQAPTHAGASDG